MNICYIDFEFNGLKNDKLNLVCVALHCTKNGFPVFSREFWLAAKGRQEKEAILFILKLIREDYTFVSFMAEAEVRSFLSLLPENSNWFKNLKIIDLYIEYRNLLNHNNALSYGKQYINGKILTTKPPLSKWEREDFDPTKNDEDDLHHKPSFSLAAAIYKLLDVMIDVQEKTDCRNIIIEGDKDKIRENRLRIQKYCMSDIKYLPLLLNKMMKLNLTMKTGLPASMIPRPMCLDWVKGATLRGNYAARTAKMIALGYPVNHEKLTKFQGNIENILKSATEDCLESTTDFKPFRINKKNGRYICNVKEIRNWVKAQNFPHWRKTTGKQVSTSKDAFGDHFGSESRGFGGSYYRYCKTKQSLNGFIPTSAKTNKGKFSDFIGNDTRIRPNFGIFGSQSSRSQPGSIGFIPLKAHWMRNFIEAPKGKALAGIDYASQEFLIAAIISQDMEMMKAYETGDVYLAFAKKAKLVPESATKTTHKSMRDLCKALVLGISYDMSAKGLSSRLTQINEKPVSEEQAQEYLDTFYNIYSDYYDWKQNTLTEYQTQEYLELPDGWTMWGDNENRRSVGNFPIQGHGAVIMREAVRMAQTIGIDVIFTLHDALYIEYPSKKVRDIYNLMSCMAQAFEKIMSPYGKIIPILLEGETWSKDYEIGQNINLPSTISVLKEYVDEKGKNDLERYRQFFT